MLDLRRRSSFCCIVAALRQMARLCYTFSTNRQGLCTGGGDGGSVDGNVWLFLSQSN